MTETSPMMGKRQISGQSVASPCRWGFCLRFFVLIVAGGKSAAEPGPQQIGKAFGKAEMT